MCGSDRYVVWPSDCCYIVVDQEVLLTMKSDDLQFLVSSIA